MAWQFGTIDFATYGVMVSRSTGVLDLPKLKHEGYDWLDEDGKEYWQAATKYNDRDIILNCWIHEQADEFNSGYINFRTKVNALIEALKIQGKCTFVTPYISISNCSFSAGINLVRETNYVQEQQVGTFSLRITVHGDIDSSLLSIYDGNNVIREIVKTSNLTLNKSLQNDRYATCTVESNEILSLLKYDFIRINSNGSTNELYHLPAVPEFRKISTNKYIYNLRFEGGESFLKQTQFKFEGESDFEIYASVETIIDLIVTNSNDFLSGRFLKGTVATTIKKNHKFTGENCLDVLRRIVAEYEMEYNLRFVGGTPIHYYFDVAEQIGNTNSVTLEYGKGNGLYELTRGQADTSKLCTVLYAYGAAKNLKADYGHKRLQCPGNPLKDNWTVYEHHEQSVFFDDIYPERTSTVTGYLQVLPEDLTAAEKEVYPEGIFAVGDTELADETYGFDLNDYLLGGLTAKIRMKTGALAGYEFDILRYDHDTQVMQIIRFQDETGYIVPNATLQIAAGDEYTLVDIDQPPIYVTEAENRVLAAATAYIEKWSTPIYPYSAKVNPAFVAANPGTGFEVGDKVTVEDADYGINELFRISAMSYNVHTGIYDLTLSDYRLLNKRQQTEFRLQTIERAMFSAKKETVEVIKNEQQPVGEVKRILLDPDNKLKVDNLILNGTIDSRMLGLDSNMPQIHLTDAWFEENVGGNVEAAKQYAGYITIQNFEGINRYEVQKKKDNSEVYDPSRVWHIQETLFTADADKSYNIYAKLDLTPESTDCEVFLAEEHIDPKAEIQDGYIIYNLGNLTKDDV